MAMCRRLFLCRRPAGIGAPPPLAGLFSISPVFRVEKASEDRIGAGRPFELILVRSFSAVAQAKPKPAGENSHGPRLNLAISSPFVRLVSDQGHAVVSRQDALDHATRLNLDLVEVQRNSDPPVCKIMDFHKEKFKQEVKEKERAKDKAAASLRSGDNKEVRFKAKTELKDLKTKAETITRLMDRGYRVKCTAMPIGKEAQDLGELLLRVLSLLEDVAFVESGPYVDTTKAYAIVRHAKFMTKKSGKKEGNVADIVSQGVQSVVSTTLKGTGNASEDKMVLQSGEEWEQVESSSDAESEINSTSLNVADGSDQSYRKSPAASNKGRSEFKHILTTHGRPNLHSSKQETQTGKMGKGTVPGKVQHTEQSAAENNRYARQSKALPSQQTMPPQPPRNSERRDQVDVAYRQRPPIVPGSPRTRTSDMQINSGGTTANMPNNDTWIPRSGNFMAQKGSTDLNNKMTGATAAKPSDSSSSSGSPRIVNSSKPFSADKHRSDESATNGDSRNSSASPRYGIFSATHSSSSNDQENVEKDVGGSGTVPRYGIFSSAKPSLHGEQGRP